MISEIIDSWSKNDEIRDIGHRTPEGIIRFDNITYGPYGKESLLDIYIMDNADSTQPVIVSCHGGGWVYGFKELYQYYCMSLAKRGFTVVNFNYRLAPTWQFPAPLEDLNAVMHFVENNSSQYHIDLENIFLVGDSAGAMLAAWYGTILTNTEYARYFDLELPSVKIKGLGLNCGIYNLDRIAPTGLEEMFSAFIGKKLSDITLEERKKLAFTDYINSDFPKAFITSSYADFLLCEAEPMHELLSNAGVVSEMKVYGSPSRDDIAHVFHVNIRLKEAEECNDDETTFFKKLI